MSFLLTSAKLNSFKVANRPIRVATFGDSTANTNSTFQDNSLFSVSSSVSPEKYQLHNLYPQAYLVANGGIGGQTTTQMLARDTLAPSTARKSIQDILDLKPDVVLLRGGSINNISSATSATVAALVSACYTEHCLIINKFLNANIPILDSGIYGYSGGGAEPAIVRSAVMQLESLFDLFAAQYSGKVFRPNWTGILRDSSGQFIPSVLLADGQGVHLNFYGQYLASAWEASIIKTIFGVSLNSRYQGINELKNAATVSSGGNSQFASSSVTGIGTVPTGYTWGTSGAGGTRANGKIENIDGKLWATMEFTPNATGGLNFFLPLDAINWGGMLNDVYGVEFDYFFKPLTASILPVNQLNAQWSWNDGTAKVINNLTISNGFTWPDSNGWIGRVIMQPSLISGIISTPQIFVQLNVLDTTAIKMGISSPRLVKLGTTSNWPPVYS